MVSAHMKAISVHVSVLWITYCIHEQIPWSVEDASIRLRKIHIWVLLDTGLKGNPFDHEALRCYESLAGQLLQPPRRPPEPVGLPSRGVVASGWGEFTFGKTKSF